MITKIGVRMGCGIGPIVRFDSAVKAGVAMRCHNPPGWLVLTAEPRLSRGAPRKDLA